MPLSLRREVAVWLHWERYEQHQYPTELSDQSAQYRAHLVSTASPICINKFYIRVIRL